MPQVRDGWLGRLALACFAAGLIVPGAWLGTLLLRTAVAAGAGERRTGPMVLPSMLLAPVAGLAFLAAAIGFGALAAHIVRFRRSWSRYAAVSACLAVFLVALVLTCAVGWAVWMERSWGAHRH